MKDRRMQVNDFKELSRQKSTEGVTAELCDCLCANVWVHTSVSRRDADAHPVHIRLRITVKKLYSHRNFNDCNSSSLTNGSAINPPILPSQLWNVFMLFLLYICTRPATCVCLCLIDIYWQITPRSCSAAGAKTFPVTVSEWSNTLQLSFFLFFFLMIMFCWSLHWLMMWIGIIALLSSLPPWERREKRQMVNCQRSRQRLLTVVDPCALWKLEHELP